MSDREDSDNEAPEEFTAEQGLEIDREIRKAQKENKKRVAQEGKQRRKKWAERLTPRPPRGEKKVAKDEAKQESEAEPSKDDGMLPAEIVNFLAAQEKQVFSSDSEEEKNAEQKLQSKMKKAKKNGPNAIILNDLPPPPCIQNSLDFLKKRKMQVRRSTSVLINSSKALRLMSSSGLL